MLINKILDMLIKRNKKRDNIISDSVNDISDEITNLEDAAVNRVINTANDNIYIKKFKKYRNKEGLKDITIDEALDDYSDILSNSRKPAGRVYAKLLKSRKDMILLAKNQIKQKNKND